MRIDEHGCINLLGALFNNVRKHGYDIIIIIIIIIIILILIIIILIIILYVSNMLFMEIQIVWIIEFVS